MTEGFQTTPLNSKFNYLELGCGNAITLLVLAALYPKAKFYGIDLMKDHIEFAKNLASSCGIKNLTLFNQSFENIDFKTLPQFNFIAAHGIISWVNKEVNENIRNIVDSKLEENGLYYTSYNALPGWSVQAPLYELFGQHTKDQKNPKDQIRKGFQLIKSLEKKESAYFKNNPILTKAIEFAEKKEINYLVHEYLQDEVSLFYFREINEQYNSIGLKYVGQTPLYQNIIDIIIPERFHDLLSAEQNDVSRQGIIDFILNTKFRKDIFIRTKKPPQNTSYSDNKINFIKNYSNNGLLENVKIYDGVEYKFTHPIYKEIYNVFAHGAQTIDSICQSVQNIDKNTLFPYIKKLIASNQIMPCLKTCNDVVDEEQKEIILKLNKALIEIHSVHSPKSDILLVSPVLGGVISLDQNTTHFLIAFLHNAKDKQAASKWIENKIIEEKRRHFEKKQPEVFQMLDDVNHNLLPVLEQLQINL